MTLDRYLLAQAAAADQSVRGAFSAGTYSIGLLRPISDGVMFPDGEVDASNARAVSEFFESLTFVHEVTHFMQFITSSFGAEYARSIVTANAKIRTLGRLNFPLTFMSNKPDEMSAYSSLEEFETYSRQLGVGLTIKVPSSFTADDAFISFPYHPMVGFDPNRPASEVAAEIRSKAPAIFSKTFMAFETDEGFDLVEGNAAALFEAYATATELEYIFRAFPNLGEDPATRIGFTRQYVMRLKPVYRIVFNAYWYHFKLSAWEELRSIKALIDIALMYNSEACAELPAWGGAPDRRHYTDAFAVFLAACQAATSVIEMDDDSSAEFERYQRDVCHAIGLPEVSELLKTTLESFQYSPSEPSQLSDLLNELAELGRRSYLIPHYLHRDALTIRQNNASAFADYLPYPSFLTALMNRYGGLVSIFSLRSRRAPEFESPVQMALVVEGQTLREFHSAEKPMVCPLKVGRPFFCASANHEAACVFMQGNDVAALCPFHVSLQTYLAD